MRAIEKVKIPTYLYMRGGGFIKGRSKAGASGETTRRGEQARSEPN